LFGYWLIVYFYQQGKRKEVVVEEAQSLLHSTRAGKLIWHITSMVFRWPSFHGVSAVAIAYNHSRLLGWLLLQSSRLWCTKCEPNFPKPGRPSVSNLLQAKLQEPWLE
jgi:hypothetical protein